MVNDLEANKSAKAVMKIIPPPARSSDRLSDDDVNMEEEDEDVKKKEDMPGERRSFRLAAKMAGQKMLEKRLRKEQGEVQMKKINRKPWNYGASGGRSTI